MAYSEKFEIQAVQSCMNSNHNKTDSEKELQMLCEYVDEFAPHPTTSAWFFDKFITEIVIPKRKYQTLHYLLLWNQFSTEIKIQCYRKYIDEIHVYHQDIVQPEYTEWYSDWHMYSSPK